jgi:O-antigen ligase
VPPRRATSHADISRLQHVLLALSGSTDELVGHTHRMAIAGEALDMIAERPLFGYGTGEFTASELEDYDRTKGSFHFEPAAPLPATLVRKLIKARLAED